MGLKREGVSSSTRAFICEAMCGNSFAMSLCSVGSVLTANKFSRLRLSAKPDRGMRHPLLKRQPALGSVGWPQLWLVTMLLMRPAFSIHAVYDAFGNSGPCQTVQYTGSL